MLDVEAREAEVAIWAVTRRVQARLDHADLPLGFCVACFKHVRSYMLLVFLQVFLDGSDKVLDPGRKY